MSDGQFRMLKNILMASYFETCYMLFIYMSMCVCHKQYGHLPILFPVLFGNMK